MKARLALAVVLMAACAVVAAQRLGGAAIAEHYDIHLAPDFTTDTFTGRVAIKLRLTAPARSITLNAAEIDFHDVAIMAGTATQTATVDVDDQRQTATFTVRDVIPAGNATLTIRYTGRLNDQLRGFYLSRSNGREYAITQLEATDARRAFPSFDEPSMKATFAVSATIDTRDTAISNGRLLSDTPGPGPGKHTLTFATTKRMSPYLVALAVGDWECAAGSADGIPVRVCGTPDHKAEFAFALESAEFALRYFNRFFSIKYPFEKLDILAVPDFSAGAMENTGAIIFREQFLLVPENGGTVEQRKQTLQFITHEIAHQWFGDLVTMAWWDDVWLNEGFATWMEFRPMREWKPEWRGELDEVRAAQRAMELDSLRATRPVRTRVETPSDINEVFDAIAYQKTGAIIRMVEGYVGAASYKDAINAYLKKFAFSNATGEGFWTTIAAVTGKPVDRVLSGFITQPGMPLVSVETRCVEGNTQLVLSQEPISPAVPDSTLWDIPVCYKRERGGNAQPSACVLLSARTQTVRLDGCSPWVFANVDSRGYYRASYDAGNLRALGEAAGTGTLTALEQTTLIADLWTLVRLDKQTMSSFLSLSGKLAAGEPGPAVSTALRRLNYIAEWLVDDKLRPDFQRWVRQALQPLMNRLGWTPKPGEPEDLQALRSAVIFTLGNAGRDADVLREARRLAGLHVTDATPVHASLADTTLELAAITGDVALYEQYLQRVNGASNPGERARYMVALSFFADPQLQQRTLALATSPNIASHDAPALLNSLMQRPSASEATWEYVKANWDTVERTFGIFQGIPTVIDGMQHFCDLRMKQDVDRFFSTRQIGGIERRLRQSLESIERCATLKSAQAANLSAFLAAADAP